MTDHPQQTPAAAGPLTPVAGAEGCAKCGAPLVADQRYCLQCGQRNGPPRIDFTAFWRRAGMVSAGAAAQPVATPQAAGAALPSRRVSAALAGVMLAAGILGGVLLGPAGGGTGSAFAGLTRTLLAAGVLTGGSAAPAQSAPQASTPGSSGGSSSETAATPPVQRTHQSRLAAASTQEAESPSTTPSEETEPSPSGSGSPGSTSPSAAEENGPPKTVPPIDHVWVIALSQGSFASDLAHPAEHPYLDNHLVPQGTLLSNYAPVAKNALANDIALLSGQAPTAANEQNCPTYVELQPPTVNPSTGLAEGAGCVYPAPVQTLADQVTNAGLTWRAYEQGMGSTTGTATTTTTSTATGTTASSTATGPTCVHPALGEAITPAAGGTAEYTVLRNPFVFFDSLLANGACADDDGGLARLVPDLTAPAGPPNLSWIAPAPCDDGAATTCTTAPTGGSEVTSGESSDTFLHEVVERITATTAYRSHGLVVVTYDAAPAGASSSQAVGTLLLSPFVQKNKQISASFNAYSLLKSLERLDGEPKLGHAGDAGTTELPAKTYTTGTAR